ncbi:MAG: type II toxin-antitoxin system MqsR family toxin [Candidatus Eisenbacteria bacterium]|nr:type II toxin-antitoxin system MqsR family toxin [Candidatus Eisenbacteria bacterium]
MGLRDRPTYELERIKALMRSPGGWTVTKTAQFEAARLGFDDSTILECVLALTGDCFYKTMPSEKASGLWQDVYHPVVDDVVLYVKLQISQDGRLAVVIQFKEK